MSEPMLTEAELTGMAEEVVRSLPSLVEISRSQGQDNEAGGEETEWEVVGSDVPARLAPASSSASLRSMAERLSVAQPWVITLPANTDCEIGDEIRWGTRVFSVESPIERDYEVSRRVLCDEITE